jgi:hypothetical protein
VALERDDVELVAVNDPFITTDYMVSNHLALFGTASSRFSKVVTFLCKKAIGTLDCSRKLGTKHAISICLESRPIILNVRY